jgi:hypothetical protein
MRGLALVFFLFFLQGECQTYNYYFGNLHAHTAFSDGNKDSTVSGVFDPAGGYAYAKLSNDFDFLGISEHNHYSSNKNPGFKLPRYQAGLNMATTANQDGSFVSLFGMEYGVASNNNGHVIIYGFNQLIGWETGVGGSITNNYDIYNAKSDYASLFKKVKNNPGSFCYLAHPWWTDFTLDGTDSTALAFMPYNSMFDSAIVGVPLRSGGAFSTFTDYSDYMTDNYFNYYRKLLYIGYHIGIGYDHDNHYTNFGRSNGGRLVIVAPLLSKAEIMSAMQNMHFYGSDDSNAKLDFRLNGQIMGSQLNGDVYPNISVIHDDPDGEKADTIRIWKGRKNGSTLSYTVLTNTDINTASYTDYDVYPGIEYYYFIDARQKDGQWIVSSPIWYTPSKKLSVQKQSIPELTIYPIPAHSELNISLSGQINYDVKLFDAAGKLIFRILSDKKDLILPVENFQPGFYSLRLTGENFEHRRKIIIR